MRVAAELLFNFVHYEYFLIFRRNKKNMMTKMIDRTFHNELKCGGKIHFGRTMHCLPQRLKSTFFEKLFERRVSKGNFKKHSF